MRSSGRDHTRSAWLPVLFLLGCTSPGVTPNPPPDNPGGPVPSCQLASKSSPEEWAAAISSCSSQLSLDTMDEKPRTDLDILFLVDNSPSMSPKQKALAENIPRLIEAIDKSGANYHVGIATSDVGSWVAPGKPWSSPLGTCNSFEGDDGALQRDPCTARTGVTKEAFDACQALCPDSSFVPTDGKAFIAKVGGITNVPKKLVGGVDVGPQAAFKCMALLGDNGCGVEGQLEGARRALDGHNPVNAGFLRPGSTLAVIYITDEDDCSVALSRRAENDPHQMDCSAPDKDAPFACFNPDYRCMARDVVCDEPTNTPGDKHHCVERASSYLDPVSKYTAFFSALRPKNKLLVSGIWSLPAADKGGKFKATYTLTGMKSYDLNRGEGTDAACVNATDPHVYGRPQVRLSKLAANYKDSIQISICDTDHYADALGSIAGAMTLKLAADCTSEAPRLDNGKPVCLVGEVDAATPDAVPQAPLPLCSDTCCQGWAAADVPNARHPGVMAACHGETAAACYCAVPSTASACSGAAVAGVWRQPGTEPAAGKVVSFKCLKAE